jgi:exopolyphosphatase / guanosine-5'-triphosphate,3'-diphosphate pyrophosphatase
MPEVLAAVDLGSNSFHLVVARYTHGQLVVIDRLREMVRLGGGVGEDGRIDRDTAERALACLDRFGQRLREMHARDVRVVGTNALRIARRKQAFLERARDALGHPIEIISGLEEARLIYSGVAHTTPARAGRRLVIDIGGGSTELIIGEAFEPRELTSLAVGCVSFTQRFFPDGRVSAKRVQRARLLVQTEIDPVKEVFLRRGWEQAVGSSGTIRSIFESIREVDPETKAINAKGLARLVQLLQDAGHVHELALTSLNAEREPVFAAGVVILAELFESMGLRELSPVEGALRDGLLYDMVGRLTDEDPRERTVASMQRRYQVDLEQAARVEKTVLALLEQVQAAWRLEDPLAELTLGWAARLHEMGLDVAHSGYHRHGAYLLENADMPGFAREEQLLLARLVGSHRRKLLLDGIEDLIPPWDRRAPYLIILLRLAVLLHRGRSRTELPNFAVQASPKTLELRFPVRWLKDHPLTVEDLQQEVQLIAPSGIRLRVYSGIRAGTE